MEVQNSYLDIGGKVIMLAAIWVTIAYFMAP